MQEARLLNRPESDMLWPERWIPKSISYAFGEPIVELARLESTPNPFFSDLDLMNTVASVRRPLMDVEIPLDARGLSPAGFIFHLPRSGSTLAARMLASSTSCACIVEPEAINALLSSSGATEGFRPAWLRRLCLLYCAAFADTHRHLFVKLSSWSVLREPFFAEAFPAVRSCFLHRDPVEVLVQLLQRPVGWMSDQARAFILHSDLRAHSMSIEEYCARALQRFCEAALNGVPRVRAVAYEDVPDIVVQVAVRHFGLDVSEADRRKMMDVARYDSDDWLVQTPYRESAADLASQATPRLKKLG